MNCSRCGAIIPAGTSVCPMCGTLLTPYVPGTIQTVSGALSPKSKVAAGVLQILLPFGIGRFYTGHTSIAVAQLLVTFFTCGLGTIWSFVDGVMMLMGKVPDSDGRPLKD